MSEQVNRGYEHAALLATIAKQHTGHRATQVGSSVACSSSIVCYVPTEKALCWRLLQYRPELEQEPSIECTSSALQKLLSTKSCRCKLVTVLQYLQLSDTTQAAILADGQ